MIDAISQFLDAISAAGLEPPPNIEPNKWSRFPGINKDNDNTAGYCKLFPNGTGGYFGDFSSDFSQSWQIKHDKPYTQKERALFKQQIADAKKQMETERKSRYAEAVSKAIHIWNLASAAPNNHPYLLRKNIKALGIRLYKGALVIPVREGEQLHSLQFIDQDGSKNFLGGGRVTGCYFSIGYTQNAKTLCVSEGFATGMTIHQATGYPVAVAFNAGNLKTIAKTMRKLFPELSIIICADDDIATKNNPGLSKATIAAQAINGLLAVPDFGPNRPERVSDFNDMATLMGEEAVACTIKNASNPPEHDWPTPQSLSTKIVAEPYPLDALPHSIKAAVEEVQNFTKAPLPLVASSAIAALSLAIQPYVNVKRAEKLVGPVGLYLITIADSGERKSTCDSLFTKAIHDYEKEQTIINKALLADHKAATEAWNAKQNGIKEKIRHLSNKAQSTSDQELRLCELERSKPKAPKIPRLLYTDATPEALAQNLATQYPSGGMLSAEAGVVLGGHSMGKDSIMRNLGLLNQLWDGSGNQISVDRKTTESFVVQNVRFTIALQIQETTLRYFFERTGELTRGIGFLARFLIAHPESTQGSRFFTEPPANCPALTVFNARMASILAQPVTFDSNDSLNPFLLELTSDAKSAWILFHNLVEAELVSGGELHDIRDVASKAADNVARLAALFHVFENAAVGQIQLITLEAASRIIAWHLNEARRFFGEFSLPSEIADAIRLDNWLIAYCQKHKICSVSQRDIQRLITPSHLRLKKNLEPALQELLDAGRVRRLENDRRIEIQVHASLINGDVL